MFIRYIYFFKNLCGVFGIALNALILLRIIFSMKRCYLGVLGYTEMYKFCGCAFYFLKSECGNNLDPFCLKHTTHNIDCFDYC